MPKSRKKKIDDYIKKPEKEHENQDYIKSVAFSTVKKISEDNSMPTYDIDEDEEIEEEEKKIKGMPEYDIPISEDKSNEEE